MIDQSKTPLQGNKAASYSVAQINMTPMGITPKRQFKKSYKTSNGDDCKILTVNVL